MPRRDFETVQSKLFSIYFHELVALCKQIQRECEEIFKEVALPSRNFVKTDPEQHVRIQAVLAAAVQIRKLVLTDPKRFSYETNESFRLRQERSATLREVLRNMELDELLSQNLRNMVERFDEDLDDANTELTIHPSPQGTMAAYNMSISSWDAYQPRLYPIRLYVVGERSYYSFQWSANLGEICQQSAAILQRMQDLKILPEDSPSGLILPIS